MTDYKLETILDENNVVLNSSYGCQIWSRAKLGNDRTCQRTGKKLLKGAEVFRPVTNGYNRSHRISAGEIAAMINTEKQKMKKVEKAYRYYLKLSKLEESGIHPVQKTETKRAFFAGFGSCIDAMADIDNSSDESCQRELISLENEIKDFFKHECETAGKSETEIFRDKPMDSLSRFDRISQTTKDRMAMFRYVPDSKKEGKG